MRLNVQSIYNVGIDSVVCSKCGKYVDADYFAGMIKVAPCKCVEVKA